MGDNTARMSVLGRLPRLLSGVVPMGIALGGMAQAGLGLGPWAVLHQGIGRQVGLPLGTVTIIVGFVLLLGWIPLRVRPGIGTLVNIAVIGSVTNVALDVIPVPSSFAGAVALMAVGVVVHGAGTAIYLSADLGPGPRDGLMTGLHRRFGWGIARTRTMIELAVLVAGFALGGTVGIGTLAYAVGVGPVIQAVLSIVDPGERVARLSPEEAVTDPGA